MFTENRSLAKALLVAAFICTLGAWLPVGDGPDLTALYRTKVKKKKKKKVVPQVWSLGDTPLDRAEAGQRSFTLTTH